MSQSQQSDFASSLYDGEIDNLTYPTSSNHPATPSGSQTLVDVLDPTFLRPAISPLIPSPLVIPSCFQRVGPNRRKAYVLYDMTRHTEWVDWWLQTDYGAKSKISWDSAHLSNAWRDFVQVAHSADGAAKIMCKRCNKILEHPHTTRIMADGRVTRHGTSTMVRHSGTKGCQRTNSNSQDGEITKFLQEKVYPTGSSLILYTNFL